MLDSLQASIWKDLVLRKVLALLEVGTAENITPQAEILWHHIVRDMSARERCCLRAQRS